MTSSRFDPSAYPDLFEITKAGKLIYKKTKKGGKAKSYAWSDPEEWVRAEFYATLVNKLHYPAENIDLEVEVYRRKPEDFADIVVFEDEALSKPYIVVECKTEGVTPAEFEQAIKQAWGNANNLGAKYAAAVAGDVQFAFEARSFDLKDREKYALVLPERYGKPIKYRYVKGDPEWDIKPATLDDLRNKFQQCHDILWEGGRRNPAQAFDEMTKLMFCKIQDERHLTSDGAHYQFQIGTHETPKVVAGKVRDIYSESRALMPNVFRSEIEVNDDLIYRVVEVLQGTSLYKTDLDAKGRAFEKFLGTVFRGDMGQYFTPRTIVEFIVSALEPGITDRVLDPACGSGGFLLHSLEKLQNEAQRRFKDVSMRRDYWKDWALRSLHGMEINDQISRVAMMGMILHEDGHTNIVCADALSTFEELRKVTSEFRVESFSKLMTNPPFGAAVKRATPKSKHPYLDTYQLGKGRNSQKTEILFIERCLEVLRPGGRMGIVLPEGMLNNERTSDVRQFVEDRAFIDAIISLPEATFYASGAAVKASVLLAQKFTTEEGVRYQQETQTASAETVKKYAPERTSLEEYYEVKIASYDRPELKEDGEEIVKLKRELAAAKDEEIVAGLKKKLRQAALQVTLQITEEDKEKQKELKREYAQRMNHLEEKIKIESRRLLKQRVNYPVYAAHAEHVGITANGQPDTNELPDILAKYKAFRAAKPLAFREAQ
jgi:type I restriction enzyme M protein